MQTNITEIDLTNLEQKSEIELDQDITNLKQLIKSSYQKDNITEANLIIDLLVVVLEEKVKRDLKNKP